MLAVFENPDHCLHAPRMEVFHGGRAPYSETPDRVNLLKAHLKDCTLPIEFIESNCVDCERVTNLLKKVHGENRIAWLKWVSNQLSGRKQYIPDVFVPPSHFSKNRNVKWLLDRGENPRLELPLPSTDDGEWFSWFCFDTHTPIVEGTYTAALGSVRCAVNAADWLLKQARSVNGNLSCSYALCRPPGHHAGRNYYGGFCYLNNAAVAAEYMLENGLDRIAIFDFDFHHGNGTQDIFYQRGDVLYVSIHGTTPENFPFFSGFADERGAGEGLGANLNLPLSVDATKSDYMKAIHDAMIAISEFAPGAIIASAGFDLHTQDPIGGFQAVGDGEICDIGVALKSLNLPVLVMLEGGYNADQLGPLSEKLLSSISGES
jgi:acetoin utilization deacetylase AcuC-like enzyme